MTLLPQASATDIVGSWRAPGTEGIELGYYFYPDGVLILRHPRSRRFAMRGAWALENGRLVISDVINPCETHSEEERELIRSERHKISIMEITPDSMVWQPEDAPGKVAFRRTGGISDLGKKSSWLGMFLPG